MALVRRLLAAEGINPSRVVVRVLMACVLNACGATERADLEETDGTGVTTSSAGTGGRDGSASGTGGSATGASGRAASGGSATSGSSATSSGGGSSGAFATVAVSATNTTGPPTTDGTCTDSDLGTSQLFDERGITRGSNGEFQDTCDENGDLVEYYCESTCELDPNTGHCPPEATGVVVSRVISCGGECEAGVCFQWCAFPNDWIRVDSVDSEGVHVTNTSLADEYAHYVCEPTALTEGFDCTSPDLFGVEFVITWATQCDVEEISFQFDDYRNGQSQDCKFVCARE